MFGNKMEKNNADNTETVKLDTTRIRVDAGKRLDSQTQSLQSGIINLDEGAGIGLEYFSRDNNKKESDK